MKTEFTEKVRRLRNAVEPVAAGVYFAPEALAAYESLGFDPSPAVDQSGVSRPESKSYLAVSDGDRSTTIRLGPEQPAGVPARNWIQTTPDKGCFAILRLSSPLAPFFDKSSRHGEFLPIV